MTPAEAITWADVFKEFGMGFVGVIVALLAALKTPPVGPFIVKMITLKLDSIANDSMGTHGKGMATDAKDAILDFADPVAVKKVIADLADAKITELTESGLIGQMTKTAGSLKKVRSTLMAVAESQVHKHIARLPKPPS